MKHAQEPLPAPPCYTPNDRVDAVAAEKAVVIAKRIGELNGPWAALLKLGLVAVPLFISMTVAWGTWVTSRISHLETSAAVITKVVDQITTNASSIIQHEKELVSLQGAVANLDKELMPMDQRLRVFVSRAEWELKTNANADERKNDREHLYRELAEMKANQQDLGRKIDMLLGRPAKSE